MRDYQRLSGISANRLVALEQFSYEAAAPSPPPPAREVTREEVAKTIWNWRDVRYGGPYETAKDTLARADCEALADRILALLNPTKQEGTQP